MKDGVFYMKKKEILPRIVYQMCVNGALIVGSYAKHLMGEVDKCNDYDLIVPHEKWRFVSLLIPQDAKLNKFGGLRFKDEKGNEIDVWQGDLYTYLNECKTKYGGKVYAIDYINNKAFSSETVDI